MRWLLLLLTISAPALAQEQEVQRALIQRDQQSAGFALQLRQSQEGATPAPGDNRHLSERQRLENVSSQQLLNVDKDPPQAPRPYERQKSGGRAHLHAGAARHQGAAAAQARAPARPPARRTE